MKFGGPVARFTPWPHHPRVQRHQYPSNRRPGGHRRRSGCFGEEYNPYILSGKDSLFIGHPAYSLVTTQTTIYCLDDWLTVHRSIILFDLQLDAQNSYLFTYKTFIKILYMFRALPCSSSGGLRRNCIYAASGIITLCR